MVERNLELGLKLPDWYEDEPETTSHHDFLLRDFWDLSSERQIGFSVGPIPTSKIEERAERNGFDDAMMRIYKALIRMLDSKFQKWVNSEREKAGKGSGRVPTESKRPRRR